MRASRPRNRRGVAAVEFAVVAPFLILLIFGIIEFGRAIMVQQVLTNASREGTRRAVLEEVTESEVTTVVSDYLTQCGVTVVQRLRVRREADAVRQADVAVELDRLALCVDSP